MTALIEYAESAKIRAIFRNSLTKSANAKKDPPKAAITSSFRTLPTGDLYFKLQMKNSILNFACSSLVPILCSYVTAGPSGNVHLGLIAVLAVGALPNKLAVSILNDHDLTVISANLTEVALCIKLCVHNIVIDKTNYFHNSI